MKTLFVGGGHGCRAVLELVVNKRLAAWSPEILGVVDTDTDAPGMLFARQMGWLTFTRLEEGLNLPGLELVVEVTGIDSVLEEIRKLAPDRVGIMDHDMARVFWDLDEIALNLREELERKISLEKEIQADRTQLQQVLDSLPDSVMVLDADGCIQRVNRKFEEITGVSPSHASGKSCRHLICTVGGDGECDEDFCPRLRVIESGKSLTVISQQSCVRRGCAGDECYYQITANPIHDADGRVSVVITSREITEQIRMAQETAQLAQRAEQILNTVQGIITISGMDGRLEFINPRAEKFFGIRKEDVLGLGLEEAFPEEVATVISQNDEAFLSAPGGRSVEETALYVQDHEKTLLTERVLLQDYRQRPAGICRISRDITESMRLQQELVESEKHAAVGKLAAGVAHELNNPLTGILTFAEDLLEDAHRGSEMHDDLKVILRETIRCRQIVRDLLDFSRQTKRNPQDVPIEPIILRAVKLVDKQAAFHDIDFDLDIHESQLRVFADPNQLQQVMLNLIINARDAMDGHGAITIRTFWRRAKRRVVVEVGDEGCGIPTDLMDQVFEPFFSTKGDRGNGLGLAAVRSIVEQHRGDVVVESQLNAGTTFSISLPVVGDIELTGVEGHPAVATEG